VQVHILDGVPGDCDVCSCCRSSSACGRKLLPGERPALCSRAQCALIPSALRVHSLSGVEPRGETRMLLTEWPTKLAGRLRVCRLRFRVHDSNAGSSPVRQTCLPTWHLVVRPSAPQHCGRASCKTAGVRWRQSALRTLSGLAVTASEPASGEDCSTDLPFAATMPAQRVPDHC
jgi:hypothetical protein